ncbi:MAG: hypothetical protein JKY15_08610, partial [Deltaproteobacteria bacterium]|nr:hypothetical protein [Deltaproteobacteria bacterium]
MKSIPIVAFSLYQEIATNSDLYQELDFPFLHQQGRNAFTAGAYEDFKPKLVEAILRPQFLKVSEEFNRLYNPFVQDDNLRALAKTYLLSKSRTDHDNLFNRISDVRLKNVLAVLYDEINHVLPLTAVRKIGVHYGPLLPPERYST